MQEQQFPQASSSDENLAAAEQAALRRVRTRRLQTALTGVGLFSLSLAIVGCPGAADNETPNDTMAMGGSGGSGGGAGGGANCDADPCVANAFTGSATACKSCHTTKTTAAGGLQFASLDLESPNPSTRLKGMLAKHTDLPMGKNMGCPSGDFLVDVNNPAQSWFWKKINGGQGTCGDAMPLVGTLSSTDKMCLQKFIECMAGKPITAGAGGTGGGGAGGA
ncbi:MAG TPA: hypothetical protein VJN18_08820, partial [Polyangiaceae bacterium]|nr:hypothetical protein [Polyangiaceae bacterium]